MQALRIINSALVTLALATAACGGGDDATGPSQNPSPKPSSKVSGSYGLSQVRSVGGIPASGNGIPVTFTDKTGDKLTISGGTLVLGSDGKFDLKVQTTFNGSGLTLTDHGTYTANGSSISFSSLKASPRISPAATVSGGKVTAKSKFYGATFEIDLLKK
jgi:hypothetical protein